ncbi:MAG: 3-hydroxyacyl-ACP dehydratase [Bacteroidetes bacterium GWF2_38_335]|nr:MAG: 3-hydroxyacyl-ACP dehydratase [Bacteroidetes bacterium GWF2_38_335]OFY81218.1 MAG: 3-hydroxyacyl-ACP dehydratase [Bacteroidetes bacterium RIFOXYA12_FULL_38_20]HBS85334.1 3-hydroxyacyl-ACP dehydratase [Bacteroidales bacterium]
MKTAGIDIGSRTIKTVFLENGHILSSQVVENTFNTIEVCKKLLENKSYESITATGYGRHLFAEHFKCEVISEIKAFATGIHFLYPQVRTILDIGGQDTKAISLDEKGRIRKFEMNDKCAAGTGRFLEIMSMALRYSIDEFGKAALNTKEKENISSMCTVFAESEVVSMLAKGHNRDGISRGIHYSIAARSASLLKRVGIENDIAFVGGVAKNPAIGVLLSELLGANLLIPENPQITGALGCAILNAP